MNQLQRGDRVQLVTSHWRGKNQHGTVVNTKPCYGRIKDMVIVKLDNIEKKRCRLYYYRSLRRLNALERLAEQAE